MIRRATFWIVGLCVAPVAVFAVVSLGAKIYSMFANPVFFGFHLGEDDRGVDVDMLSPAVASIVIIGCAALLYAARRFSLPHRV